MSSATLETEVTRQAARVHVFLQDWFNSFDSEKQTAIGQLIEAMKYSALGGGKRFRPVLSLMVADALELPAEKILPWAAAVEMIHTYSLIHDDLPMMDDDDVRRGRPTNHKVYGDATALLAGDALLTEAFGFVGRAYANSDLSAGRLVELLAQRAGATGMVGGQALDMAGEKNPDFTLKDLYRMHALKTGGLIAAATEGAGLVAKVSTAEQFALREFGENLGLAFQIADDILDSAEEGQAGRSFVALLGLEGTKAELQKVSEQARHALSRLPKPAPWLHAMIDWNIERKQ